MVRTVNLHLVTYQPVPASHSLTISFIPCIYGCSTSGIRIGPLERLIVLQNRDKDARGCQSAAVQRMDKTRFLPGGPGRIFIRRAWKSSKLLHDETSRNFFRPGAQLQGQNISPPRTRGRHRTAEDAIGQRPKDPFGVIAEHFELM